MQILVCYLSYRIQYFTKLRGSSVDFQEIIIKSLLYFQSLVQKTSNLDLNANLPGDSNDHIIYFTPIPLPT